MRTIVLTALLLGAALANDFHIKNNCKFTVWPALVGNAPYPHPGGGGFELKAGESRVVAGVQHDWGGRIWGRTGCDAQGMHCETGDCGKLGCSGWGAMPATLAEIKLGDLDFYDISNVDGFNLPIRFAPIVGSFKNESNPNHYYCQPIACSADLNAKCPSELAVKVADRVVACASACTKFRLDVYCCAGAHQKPQDCLEKDFPHNYPKFFKDLCPDAYSWAYDDAKSTFTCRGAPVSNYDVVFCP